MFFVLPDEKTATAARAALQRNAAISFTAGQRSKVTLFEVTAENGGVYRGIISAGKPMSANDPEWVQIDVVNGERDSTALRGEWVVRASRPGVIRLQRPDGVIHLPLRDSTPMVQGKPMVPKVYDLQMAFRVMGITQNRTKLYLQVGPDHYQTEVNLPFEEAKEQITKTLLAQTTQIGRNTSTEMFALGGKLYVLQVVDEPPTPEPKVEANVAKSNAPVIDIHPIPPAGGEITKENDGTLSIRMEQPGFVVLGSAKVAALKEDYAIEFAAEGLVMDMQSDADVSLVVRAKNGTLDVHATHGTIPLTGTSKEWGRLRTWLLALKGRELEKIVLGIDFKSPGKVQLKNLSVSALGATELRKRNENASSAASSSRVPAESVLQMRWVADAPSEKTEELRLLGDLKRGGILEALHVQKASLLDETAVESVDVVNDAKAGSWGIAFQFTESGGRRFAELTGGAKGRKLAIVIDRKLYAAPVITGEIAGGRAVIQANWPEQVTRGLAANIAAVLKAVKSEATPDIEHKIEHESNDARSAQKTN